MAKRGGFSGGMPGNMNNLMKQAQKMQRQMEETTKELETKEYTATAGVWAEAFLSNPGLLQQSDNDINRRACQASRNRKQICTASGISHYQYAGGISNEPRLIYY